MYFAVDDQAHGHRKFVKLGAARMAATGLWTTAGSWASGHMTDGFVPDYLIEQWDPGLELAKRLVAVGLWIEDEVEGDAGFRFHQWADRNGTKEQITAKRQDDAERQRRHRESRRRPNGTLGPRGDGPGGGENPEEVDGLFEVVTPEEWSAPVTRDTDVTNAEVSRESHHPIPSHPIPNPPPTDKDSSTAARPTRDPAGFAEFWDACPRKVGKGAARKAFVRAVRGAPLREGESRATTLTLRMRFMASYWVKAGTEPEFVPHPATWLNQERYLDPPPALPSRAPALPGAYSATAGEGPTYNGVRPSGRIPTTTQRVADTLALKELFPDG